MGMKIHAQFGRKQKRGARSKETQAHTHWYIMSIPFHIFLHIIMSDSQCPPSLYHTYPFLRLDAFSISPYSCSTIYSPTTTPKKEERKTSKQLCSLSLSIEKVSYVSVLAHFCNYVRPHTCELWYNFVHHFNLYERSYCRVWILKILCHLFFESWHYTYM